MINHEAIIASMHGIQKHREMMEAEPNRELHPIEHLGAAMAGLSSSDMTGERLRDEVIKLFPVLGRHKR